MNHQIVLLMEGEVKKNTENRKRNFKSLRSSEVQGLQLDEEGMILPHSILGSLEDFKSYLETQGDTELVKRIPKKEPRFKAVKSGCGVPSFQTHERNALQNWQTHMKHRRQQQEHLSDVLHKPVNTLLLNQANHFRYVQEQREYIYQVKPLTQTGCSHCAGSEFWKLPQKYGDEITGISATLTRREKGRLRPITRVGQPASICVEAGTESLRPSSHSWQQSLYLHRQYQKLEQFFKKTKKPVFSGLEVIGKSSCSSLSHGSPLKKETEENEFRNEDEENEDKPQSEEFQPILRIPALRFFGHPSHWTGNTAAYKEEVGISVTIIFEALAGKIATSSLEMHNVGSTGIFYSWQQLPLTKRFNTLHSQPNNVNFYFDSSSRVILPAEIQHLEFMFKAEHPGVKTEVWQLNTHPLLLQGASIKVTLKGTSLYQDTSADQRLFIEAKLENKVKVKICQCIVNEIVHGIRSRERPNSPANWFKTEEQLFIEKNPKLRYLCQPVEDLAELWHQINPDHVWDLSVDTLEGILLALPVQGSPQNLDTKEAILTRFNSLLFKLSEPVQIKHWHLSATVKVRQLWIALLDSMPDEALWLRNLLGLPENKLWPKDESYYCDADLICDDERNDKKATTKAERTRRKTKKRDDAGKRAREKHAKDSQTDVESVDQQSIDDHNWEIKALGIYLRLLHIRVYVWMENLVETLCSLIDKEDEEDTLNFNNFSLRL